MSMRDAGEKTPQDLAQKRIHNMWLKDQHPQWGKNSTGIAALLKLVLGFIYLNDQWKINVNPLSIYPVNNSYSILIFKLQHCAI